MSHWLKAHGNEGSAREHPNRAATPGLAASRGLPGPFIKRAHVAYTRWYCRLPFASRSERLLDVSQWRARHVCVFLQVFFSFFYKLKQILARVWVDQFNSRF